MNAKVAPVSVKLKVPFETAVEPLSKKSVRPNILSKQPNLNKMIPPKANKLEEVNIPKESNRLTVSIIHLLFTFQLFIALNFINITTPFRMTGAQLIPRMNQGCGASVASL